MTTYTDDESLAAALDKAAPDKTEWRAGRKAYYDVLAEGGSTEEGYYAALDAAAPDKVWWRQGELVLLSHGKLTNHDGSPARIRDGLAHLDRVKVKSVDTLRSLFTQRSSQINRGE